MDHKGQLNKYYIYSFIAKIGQTVVNLSIVLIILAVYELIQQLRAEGDRSLCTRQGAEIITHIDSEFGVLCRLG